MWNDYEPDNTLPDAGCSWPVEDMCTTTDPPAAPCDRRAEEWAEQLAIEILWAASGRQFGLCVDTYRPCRERECRGGEVNQWELAARGTSISWDPWAGSVFAQIGCGCAGACTCEHLTALTLWHRRVREVLEVVIDGVVLPSSSYRLRKLDGKWKLLRLDGEEWPSCQDWNVASGEPGSWSVRYAHGRPVPMGGRVSAGVLKCELIKALTDAEDCELPKRTQSITRAGVNITFLDPFEFLDKGRTGLEIPDMWLSAVNPNSLQRRARVYRHDDPRRRARQRR